MVHKDVFFLITIKIVITITLSKSYENLRRCRIGKCKEKQTVMTEKGFTAINSDTGFCNLVPRAFPLKVGGAGKDLQKRFAKASG